MRGGKELKKEWVTGMIERHVIHVEHDLKSARKMIRSKGTRIILLACIFFFLILNNRNIYCPRKKKDSTHRFLYFYVQIFVYCIWKILSLMSLFIFADILKEHAIQMSQTFYVTCNRSHPSLLLYKIFRKPQFTYESFILYILDVYIKFRILK